MSRFDFDCYSIVTRFCLPSRSSSSLPSRSVFVVFVQSTRCRCTTFSMFSMDQRGLAQCSSVTWLVSWFVSLSDRIWSMYKSPSPFHRDQVNPLTTMRHFVMYCRGTKAAPEKQRRETSDQERKKESLKLMYLQLLRHVLHRGTRRGNEPHQNAIQLDGILPPTHSTMILYLPRAQRQSWLFACWWLLALVMKFARLTS